MATKNAYKDYLLPIKCVVTRIDDPAQLNRVQVYIPSLHGELSEDSKGRGDSPGFYPWAQMCTTLFKDNNNSTVASLHELFAGNVPVILPPVGTIGWILFEGGDVRAPIYMGSLSKGEANEYVTSVYSGSDNQNLSVGITGTSQLDIMKNIIFEQESGGKYDDINPKDVDAISIGLIQWHGDRARNLLIDIRNANPSDFNSKCSNYNADFQNVLGSSWSKYYIESGDRNYLALKAILATDYSKQCQDNLVKADLSKYVEVAVSLGVTEFGAQIYFCDMYNQSPAGASSIASSTSDKSLDGLHSRCLNGGFWLGSSAYHNRDRRIRVYNSIKLLASNGGLNPTSSTNLNGTQSLGIALRYPTASKNVVEPYESNHKYITIESEAYADVVAPMGGNAYFSKKSNVDGWYVEITNGKYIVRLCNLADYVMEHEGTKNVELGEKIGRVGYSSTWKPCLIMKFKVNGTPTDPLPYFNDGVSSNNISGNGVIETAVNWMINIANDNTHGYSQKDRTGPNYDCTSLCTHGYINAGITGLDPYTYTGNMKEQFTANGFTAIAYSAGMDLQRGDVLFWHHSGNKGHAVCYIGNGQIVSAHSNKDGRSGDSSGAEIDVSSFYNTHWQWVLRYNG